MNSIPAFSKAFCTDSMVLIFPDGTPPEDSKRIKAEMPTPAWCESRSLDQSNMARAARIWALVIKLFIAYNELN